MSNIKVNETQIRVHIRYISPHYHALVSDEDVTECAIFAASASLPAPVTVTCTIGTHTPCYRSICVQHLSSIFLHFIEI
jgi:hypothetical protein